MRRDCTCSSRLQSDAKVQNGLDLTALSLLTLFLHKFYGCPALYVVSLGMPWEKTVIMVTAILLAPNDNFSLFGLLKCEGLETVSPKPLSEMFAHHAIHMVFVQ